MQRFIGTKEIRAVKMTRLEYNIFRGWTLPADENGLDEGFLVEYVDGGEANTAEYAGYVSWSPKDVFENAYHATDQMSFGDAIYFMKKGEKVARRGWNGKGMFLFLVPGSTFAVNRPPLLGIYEEGTIINYSPHVDMKTADGSIIPWLCSQSDMLAHDWMIV
jgi:hypothetical protein